MGSRESKLAIAQTEVVIKSLKKFYPDTKFEIITMKTRGDKFLNTDLSKLGGKGLFVKEIEEAILSKDIDMAVHSLKDMPFELPEGLCISAITRREDARDVFISADGTDFENLGVGAKIGTSSLRRACQIKALRPDISILPLRGNILTRIEKMKEKGLDGIILAAAGIKRLELQKIITKYFSPEEIVPAVGQGALAVETRIGDEMVSFVQCINHKDTADAVKAERAYMRALGGSCKVPLGGYGTLSGHTLNLMGMLEKDGEIKKSFVSGSRSKAQELGNQLAAKVGGKI